MKKSSCKSAALFCSIGDTVLRYQVQYRNDLSVSILAKISPSGRASMISIADANQDAETDKDIAPRF